MNIKLPHNHQEDETALEQIPSLENCQMTADVFRQLGDGNRVRIFWLLCHCEECVINISALMQMSSPAVSHHLRQLKTGGLITGRRKGKEVYYRAADTRQAGSFIFLSRRLWKLPARPPLKGKAVPEAQRPVPHPGIGVFVRTRQGSGAPPQVRFYLFSVQIRVVFF